MGKANFKVDARLASLLGETYRSTEYALKELVDNAWDADATVISIVLPEPMSGDPIIVDDNGVGMTEAEVRNEYLSIANDRRSRRGSDRSALKNRRVKGRKGIGKFAGLMVASLMKVETTARGKTTRLVITKKDLQNVSLDLERIDLPIDSVATDDPAGTKVTLSSLSDRFEFPSPQKLKTLLMMEYGREQGITISVNSERLGLEDVPGEGFQQTCAVEDAGDVRLMFKVSEDPKPLKQPGIVLRIGGKVVGKPGFFGLEDDPEIPPKVLKRVYGELEADGLIDSVTADWGDVVENSKGMHALRPVVQAHVKAALEQVFQTRHRASARAPAEGNQSTTRRNARASKAFC